MRNSRTCGEAIVALLEKYDVETVFGIPGVHTLELYRGLVGSPLRHVLSRHEQGAGFMADGYARATGKPGVCFLITGPGVTNAATPIAQAYSDSIPMLVISSVNETESLGKGRGELHEMPDQLKMTSAFTAFSARADRPEQFPALLARAFDVFRSARPRPVHIEVPINIFTEQVNDVWQPEVSRQKPIVASEEITQAVNLLQAAERPLLVLGGGAKGAEAAVLFLAEALAAPVATTVNGTGILPCSHPMSLGPTLVSRATRDMVGAADVVLAAGTELAPTETWENDLDFSGKLIRLDIDPVQFDNHYKGYLNLAGDAKDALERIAASVDLVGDMEKYETRSAEVSIALKHFETGLSPAEKVRARVFRAVVDAVGDEALIAGDMTQIGYTGHSVFRPETSGRMLFPNGYGTLGYAVPAGIGAQLGAPEKPVVVFVGDGGLLYTVQEMATALEEELPILVVLWNNDLLQQIHEGFVEHEIEPIAVFPKNPDFAKLTKAFGWNYRHCDSEDSIGPVVAEALQQAVANRHPVLIEIAAKSLENKMERGDDV